MTQPPQPPPQQGPPPVDPGNGLLAETPAQLSCALIDTPNGQRLALTIRTTSTTLTLLMGHADARAWGAQLGDMAGRMSKSGLVVATPGMPNGSGAPRG